MKNCKGVERLEELKITTATHVITIEANTKVLDRLQSVAPQIDIYSNEPIVYFSECIDDSAKDMTLGYLIDLIAQKEKVSSDYTVDIRKIIN